jgi:two-component system, chemotaxis family, protein-glutamate methylesterase/glutaminase
MNLGMTSSGRSEKPVRVLIVDDSAMIRKVLTIGLSADPGLRVIGAASDAVQALEMVRTLRPDVITLDIEMPHMDGVTFLQRLMPVDPIPTVVISSITVEGATVTLRALEAGAVDIIAKPSLGVGEGLPIIMADVCRRVRAAAGAKPTPGRTVAPARPVAAAMPDRLPRVLAVGASTGGVQALARLLSALPADAPGMVVVQHMPEGFTAAFAARLNTSCTVTVREAQDGDRVEPGLVLLAPGGKRHMVLTGTAPNWRVALQDGDPVCFARPSVDVLFASVARRAGQMAAAALLTGMGRDGAAGMSEIRRVGGHTIAQDEATSVVWGMPAAAVELDAAATVLPLDDIAESLLNPPLPTRLASRRTAH